MLRVSSASLSPFPFDSDVFGPFGRISQLVRSSLESPAALRMCDDFNFCQIISLEFKFSDASMEVGVCTVG